MMGSLERRKFIFFLISIGALLPIAFLFIAMSSHFRALSVRDHSVEQYHDPIQKPSHPPLAEDMEWKFFEKDDLVLRVSSRKIISKRKRIGFFSTPFRTPELMDVQMSFYEDGQLVSTLKSDKAMIEMLGKRPRFEGNVRLVDHAGRIYECRDLTWSSPLKCFETDGKYLSRIGADVSRGKGLRVQIDSDRKYFEMLEGVFR